MEIWKNLQKSLYDKDFFLSSWGTNKVGTTLVDNMDMKINGIDYNYGIPSYTDDAGILYFLAT